MGNAVVHFEIGGKNTPALSKYYGDLFGWKTNIHEPSGYGMIDTEADGTGIGGGVMTTPDGKAMVTFYVAVDDLTKSLEQAEKLGGKTVMPPMDVPEGPSLALFSDPEGNVIGLVTGM
jgi:predicted enzyme related to lactoylglutathione lyase